VSSLRRSDRGSAIVEFHFLGILLLVPLVYILLAVLDVQRTSYGVTQAAREAGRIFAAACCPGSPRCRNRWSDGSAFPIFEQVFHERQAARTPRVEGRPSS
jgi:hypothetical protein